MGYIESRERREEEEFKNWENARNDKLGSLKTIIGDNLEVLYFKKQTYLNKIPIIIPKKYPGQTFYPIASSLIVVDFFLLDDFSESNNNCIKVHDGLLKITKRGIVIKVHSLPEIFLNENNIKVESWFSGDGLVVDHKIHSYKECLTTLLGSEIRYLRIDKNLKVTFTNSEIDDVCLDIIGHRNEKDLICNYILITEEILQRFNNSLYLELIKTEIIFENANVRISYGLEQICFSCIFSKTNEELELFCFHKGYPFFDSIMDILINQKHKKNFKWKFNVIPFVKYINKEYVNFMCVKKVPFVSYHIEQVEVII